MSKDYHTKQIPQISLKIILKINLLNSRSANDKFLPETITRKIEKYHLLIYNITNRGWKIEPLIVITTGARTTTHTPSMKILEEKLKILEKTIRQTFSEINTIAI